MWTGLTILQRASQDLGTMSPGSGNTKRRLPRQSTWLWQTMHIWNHVIMWPETTKSRHLAVCGLLRLKKIGDTDFPLGSQRHGGMLHDGVY